MIVITDFERVEPQEGVAFSEGIEIEQKFIGSSIGVKPPQVGRVLFSFFCAREIEITTQAVGNGKIGLQNATEHLVVKRFLKSLRGLQYGVGEGILCFEINNHLGISLFAQPGVVVDATITV